MDGQSDDPLLGLVKEQLARRKARPDAQRAPVGQDSTPTSSLDETARDTSHALNLRDVTAAGWLWWIMSTMLSDKISPEAFKQYRDILLEDAGSPSDPLEIMLIEQLALAHFSIGRLQVKSCSMEVPKLATAYADSATRLLGEFRRCTLALEDFRSKQAARKRESASNDAAEKTVPAARNGESLPSTNGKKKPPTTKQRGDGHTEMPECLQKRMAPLAPNGSLLAAATSGNGRG